MPRRTRSSGQASGVANDLSVPRETETAPRRVPVVAIVGRPNAGKSMLFNRLVGAERAIVDRQPGVTRDRNIAPASWEGRCFLLIDTGGFEDAGDSSLASSVRLQSALAAEEADVVIALFDGRAGLSPADRDLLGQLRRQRKPVLYAVNKLDTPAHDAAAADFFGLGIAELFPISAAHGRGISDLMEHVFERLPSDGGSDGAAAAAPATSAVTLAIVGRPNAGKSSLLNRIVGYERAIVDAAPGTTRDALDTPFTCHGQRYILIDTAGIRRRPRVHEQVERASVTRAFKALTRAEVAILVIDATAGFTDQDVHIASYAWDHGRAVLLAVNKWDALPRVGWDPARFLADFRQRYATFGELPAVFVSARTGSGIDGIFPALEKLVATHRKQLRTVQLNDVLGAAVEAQSPPSVHGKRPRFFYATQTGTAPPTITIFASAPELLETAYERYLANAFRRAFALHGTPLRLRFRSRPRSER